MSSMNIPINEEYNDLPSLYWFAFFIFGVLTPLSAIFQLYHGDQF
jgi:hypothetical protein